MSSTNTKSAYTKVACLAKPKGIKGEIVAIASGNGLPLCIYEGMKVWIVPPVLRGVRETEITSIGENYVEKTGELQRAVITLQGVNDVTSAYELQGRYLLASCDDVIINVEKNLCHSRSSVGKRVSDVRFGDVGVIVQERDNIAQLLWVVDGEYGEVLIPAVEELIVSSTEDEVIVNLPDGLLELNR
ncbi:MAG: hypothetical protein LBG97_00785 [Coriobacteriales bacterium]|jgi:16S rRNA processing protein RimM|nr:hypothetical protein [Coriobacteriales bacterium]